MRAPLAFACIAFAAWSAPAQARSATWYANNPREHAAMLDWCRDNPGPARRSDDCAAASRANLLLAQREAQRRTASSPPPGPPHQQLKPEDAEWLCPAMGPAFRAKWGCPAERRT
ncbi:EexN family lipoprotein [Roseicella aquatilis]|uniref:EexN family lipoprotein n=1 Tax=Roseicella aquatilis TaxID=2527868 RepID=UPI0014048B6C|nr:EexN family lipoprotein [Roseicella aquatilis]